jgi:thiosulfate/3-mercaptopyruvate sulfurtransferase
MIRHWTHICHSAVVEDLIPQIPPTLDITHSVAFPVFPRAGIEPGHIPGSVNIPFTEFLTNEGLEKSPEEIKRLFKEKKVDLSKPLVATCGSGVTACHVVLGAFLCGKSDVPVYDGSWVEWYMRAQPEHIISEGRGKTQ